MSASRYGSLVVLFALFPLSGNSVFAQATSPTWEYKAEVLSPTEDIGGAWVMFPGENPPLRAGAKINFKSKHSATASNLPAGRIYAIVNVAFWLHLGSQTNPGPYVFIKYLGLKQFDFVAVSGDAMGRWNKPTYKDVEIEKKDEWIGSIPNGVPQAYITLAGSVCRAAYAPFTDFGQAVETKKPFKVTWPK